MTDQPTGEIRAAKKEDKPPKTAKEKRTRIVLIALTAVFGLLLVIQGPTLLSVIGIGGGDDSAPVAEATPPAQGAEAAASGSATQDDFQAPDELPESDLPQRAETHELSKIDGFTNGDPFVPIVTPPESTEDTSGAPTDTDTGDTEGTSGGGSAVDEGGSGNNDNPSGDTASGSEPSGSSSPAGSSPSAGSGSASASNSSATDLSGARLVINDVSQNVSAGAAFPASNPVFVLNVVEAGAVQVGLTEGAFSTGTESISIELGEVRTLVSQPDGVRYSVRYEEPLTR